MFRYEEQLESMGMARYDAIARIILKEAQMFALILAGGKGERLKPLTDTIPKPMVQIQGRPILWYQIANLRKAGVTDVLFLCGYRWEAIRDFFGDGKSFNVNAHYYVEEEPLGRGGALKKGLGMIPQTQRAVFALNGDVLTTQELGPMMEAHQRSQALATLMLTQYPSTYGVVEIDSIGNILSFKEKGFLPHWINAGVYVLDPEIKDELPEIGDHEATCLPRLASQRRLHSYQSRATWLSVDTYKDLREAEEIVQLERMNS